MFAERQRYLCGVVPRWQTKVEFSGGHSDAADTAATASRAALASYAESAAKADEAGRADTADRLTSARTIALTGDVSASGSFSGGANLSLSATSAKTAAVKDQSSPSSRTIRFRVAAAGKLQFQSSYYNNSTWYNMDGTQA